MLVEQVEKQIPQRFEIFNLIYFSPNTVGLIAGFYTSSVRPPSSVSRYDMSQPSPFTEQGFCVTSILLLAGERSCSTVHATWKASCLQCVRLLTLGSLASLQPWSQSWANLHPEMLYFPALLMIGKTQGRNFPATTRVHLDWGPTWLSRQRKPHQGGSWWDFQLHFQSSSPRFINTS